MSKITFAEQFRYRFDNFMSKGTIALVSGLALVSLAFIVLMGFLVSLARIAPQGDTGLNPFEAMWAVLMRTLDAGTMGGDEGWSFRLAMLFVTFGGIFIISTLIGVLSSGIDIKLEDLRKGRSRVIETDHIVILGWSLQIITLINQLILANANRSDTCIVILSPEDKVQMEDHLYDQLGKLRQVRLVCRTGNPSNLADLGMVNIQAARSIIILNESPAKSDINLIKILLAIKNLPRLESQPYHIVAQVQDINTLDIIQLIGQDEIEGLLTQDLISRIIVQTCRQSGLSIVYLELLDFTGVEIYIHEEPALQGQSYGDILLAYKDSAVIGMQLTDGTIQLNPSIERILQPAEKLVLLSEDDSTIRLSGVSKSAINHQGIQLTQKTAIATSEHTLILGWNDRISRIVLQLDQYVASNSSVTLVSPFPETDIIDCLKTLNLQQQTLHYYQGSITERNVLESLSLEKYHHVIVLSNPDLDPEEADAQTLITLIYLRDIADRKNPNIQIVTEMLDTRNQALAQVARPDDFVITEQIISRMLAQVSEQKSLNSVFAELFSPEGSEIYLKPVVDYVKINEPINFYTVVEAAKQRGESAIGYRCLKDAQNLARGYGIVLNPKKDEWVKFSPQDRIIVLADC